MACHHDGAQKIETKQNGGKWYRYVTCLKCGCLIEKKRLKNF